MLKSITFIIYVLMIYSAQIVADGVQNLPSILRHSDPNISVYQGDKIKLTAEIGPGDYRATWVRQQSIICRDVECEVDTTQLDYGTHKFVLVVYNNLGSRSVNLRVRILTPTPGSQPKVFTPDIVDYRPDHEEIGTEDLLANTKQGIAYSFSKEKIQVLALAPRNLVWNETIKTEGKSVVEFGRASHDQHFLVDKGKIRLEISEDGQRMIHLENGDLRSRQLDNEKPSWVIKVGEKIRVEGDPHADLLVQTKTKGKKITIQVLRGVTRLVLDESKAEDVIYIPQGVRVELNDGVVTAELLPLSAVAGRAVRMTTPQYFEISSKEESRMLLARDPWVSSKEYRGVKSAKVQEVAKNYLHDNDPLLAIEVLLPHFKNKNESIGVLLAEAYFAIGAYGRAEEILALVAKPGQESSAWMAVRSKIWLLQSEYDKVFDLLYKQEIEKNSDNSHLYYRGVAQYRLGLEGGAFNDFKDCSEYCKDATHQASSKEFLKVLQEDKWFLLRGFLGVHLHNNIFRLSSNSSKYGNISNKASGYYAGAGVHLRMFEDRLFAGRFNFDINRQDYFDQSLSGFSPIYQRFQFEFDLKFGGTTRTPYVKMTLAPYLTMLFLDDSRTADILGMDFSVSFPMWIFQPSLFMGMAKLVDPLPDRDDVLDPVTKEIVAPSDRSTSLKEFGFAWSWYQTEALDVYNRFALMSNNHTSSISQLSDYDEHNFSFGVKYKPSRDNHLNASLMSRKRTHDKVSPRRVDNAYGVDVDWRHFLHQYLYFEMGLNYLTQDSLGNNGSYSTNQVNTGVGIQF